jgi:FKBP-type peptidyl-prolyl cis-trans isomerase (trigger factor)
MKTQTAEEIFCKIHTDYHGEEITSLKQLKFQSFTGEELFEFCQFVTTTQIEELRERLKEEVKAELIFDGYGNIEQWKVDKNSIDETINNFLKEINGGK